MDVLTEALISLPIALIMISIGVGVPIVYIDFISFLIKGKRVVSNFFIGIAEAGSLIILPYVYAGFGNGYGNLCCGNATDTAMFAPQHQLTIAVIIILCLSSYFFSKFRLKLLTPIVEVVLNSFLLIGIVLNIFIAFHATEPILGNIPIILLFVLMLIKNQRLFIEQSAKHQKSDLNKFESFAWNILSAKPLLKFPVLLIFCLPVLVIITVILLLFGQKPDSIIRAFTDTYKHGFSQLTYNCDNVNCGGHYLCSVAANGHQNIVKPIRLGKRNGNDIICNRQLLISNAFEDLIQEKLPSVHHTIRKKYNKVGNLVHSHYHLFNNKYLADLIYLLMKPLELIFILALYTFDVKPENRIAKQYLSYSDTLRINQYLH